MPGAELEGLIEYVIRSLLFIILYHIIGMIVQQGKLFFDRLNQFRVSVALTFEFSIRHKTKKNPGNRGKIEVAN